MFIISTTCLQSMEEVIHWNLFGMWVQKLYTQNCYVWTDIQTDRKEKLLSTLKLSSRTHKNGSVLHFLMTSVHLSGLTKNNISFEESGPDYSLCKFPIYHYIDLQRFKDREDTEQTVQLFRPTNLILSYLNTD